MKDIETRADLELVLTRFYQQLLGDQAVSYIFTDVAKIDLASHLPLIADFWEQNIFGTGQYQNNVMKIHLDLNSRSKFTASHFNIWLSHFYETIDANFAGSNAELMKTRALSIATVMQIKMKNSQ